MPRPKSRPRNKTWNNRKRTEDLSEEMEIEPAQPVMMARPMRSASNNDALPLVQDEIKAMLV
eukprot:5018315-Amphidinium_carterae.1